jgi:hypothetical protein
MKISYITGINAPSGKDGMAGWKIPKTYKFSGVQDPMLIGNCCCNNRIGDDTIPSYHKGDWKGSFDNGLDWYRVRREQDKGAPKLSTGSIVEWRAKQVSASSFRAAFLAFIRANGGGVATSMYNAIFRVNPKLLPIPTTAKVYLAQDLAAYAKRIGAKIPTERQKQAIKGLMDRSMKTLDASKGGSASFDFDFTKFDPSALTRDLAKETSENAKKAYETILGKGQYELNLNYNSYADKETKKLESSYTIPAATEKAQKEYYDGMQVKWFWMGGNPEDLTEAVIEGNQKSPRGRDANYMLMVAKTRGLKAKDVGLIIRGFVSGFAGNKFDWGSDSTYIFGTKGIGLTGAEVAAWVGANLPLITTALGLIGTIFKSIKGVGESGAIKREIDKLLTEGWVTEEDYLGFTMPRPKVLEVKRFDIPTTELDGAALLDVAITLASGSAKGQEIKQEAAADPNTNAFLQKAVALGTKVEPKTGYTSVSLVKIDPNDLGKEEDKTSMAGGLLLPMLIGVGVVMALNTAKKQQK